LKGKHFAEQNRASRYGTAGVVGSPFLRPATRYQVDLIGTPDQVRLSVLPDM
jgi:hypothetical protein